MKYMLLLLFSIVSISAAANTPADEQAIRSMLADQVVQWNRGNIDGYMVGYWENDSLVFIGKSGPTYGYRATLERYKKAYPDAAHMGTLSSVILKLRLLSPEWAYVTGKWSLKREAGDVGGNYTLLLRRISGHWVIVEDHTS